MSIYYTSSLPEYLLGWQLSFLKPLFLVLQKVYLHNYFEFLSQDLCCFGQSVLEMKTPAGLALSPRLRICGSVPIGETMSGCIPHCSQRGYRL